MSHRRVKVIDYYEDDYLDDEDTFDEPEGQGPSAEDKEQLRLGTIEVRAQLGSNVDVLDQEIQEALWYYYYDVGKTVTYIKNKRKLAPSKGTEKAKTDHTSTSQSKLEFSLLSPDTPSIPLRTAQLFLQTIIGTEKGLGSLAVPRSPESSQTLRTSGSESDASIFPPSSSSLDQRCRPSSAQDFFHDCPWLDVPPQRRAEIQIEPLYRPGLLGGSPASAEPQKTSKLAALAAKRREEKEKAGKNVVKAEDPSRSDVSASLQRLRLNNITNQEPIFRRKKTADARRGPAKTPNQPTSSKSPIFPQTEPKSVSDPTRDNEVKKTQSLVDIAALSEAGNDSPSLFAKTLLVGEASVHSNSSTRGFNTQQVLYGVDTKGYDFIEPSPDDRAIKAQKGIRNGKDSIKAESGGAAIPSNKQSSVNNLDNEKYIKEGTIGLEQLSLQDPNQHIGSKKIDVLAEYNKQNRKNAVNFVVVGHVDSGKSTLMGKILVETGGIDKRTMDQYKREAEKTGKSSFAFAWILDQGSEERERGVTMDISTNKFSTEKTNFTILDAPGHRDFVPNMIAGAAQADLAVLVVDATTGEFESGMKGQTREHALLVRSIGVNRIIVAVNKMDAANWSQSRFQEIQQQMSAFLTTAGFQRKNLSFIPCSGLTGSNILTKSTDPAATWYAGSTLTTALDSTEPRTHAIESPLRMTITDIFSSPQNPISIAGRLDSGSLQIGSTILIQPSGATARIKSLDVDSDPSDWAVAGNNVVLNLTSIEPPNLVAEGSIVCDPSSPIPNLPSFTAKVLAFEHLTPMFVTVHRGRQTMEAQILRLLATLDKGSNEIARRRPKMVKPGEWARVEVGFLRGEKWPLDRGARVVLRSGGETVIAGLVE